MNANGSDVTRLTNNSAYDGKSSWLPAPQAIRMEVNLDAPLSPLSLHLPRPADGGTGTPAAAGQARPPNLLADGSAGAAQLHPARPGAEHRLRGHPRRIPAVLPANGVRLRLMEHHQLLR